MKSYEEMKAQNQETEEEEKTALIADENEKSDTTKDTEGCSETTRIMKDRAERWM